MRIIRCSRFLSWSPLIRLLPTLASRLRSFGCTLVCQGLSSTSHSYREDNGLVWTPLAKIRAVRVPSISTVPSPLTCILTVFQLSLRESEKEKGKQKDDEEKWKDTQALLVDCHRVKGDLLLWNQLFQVLRSPITELPPSTPPPSGAELCFPSFHDHESIVGVEHKKSISSASTLSIPLKEQ